MRKNKIASVSKTLAILQAHFRDFSSSPHVISLLPALALAELSPSPYYAITTALLNSCSILPCYCDKSLLTAAFSLSFWSLED